MSVGMPQTLALLEFGDVVCAAFGEIPYHVGSSLRSKKWRDVDVRLMLPDDVYEKMGFGHPEAPHSSPRWIAMVRAFAALGRQMTGLPIDFQIQQTTYANKHFGRRKGCERSALFLVRDNINSTRRR